MKKKEKNLLGDMEKLFYGMAGKEAPKHASREKEQSLLSDLKQLAEDVSGVTMSEDMTQLPEEKEEVSKEDEIIALKSLKKTLEEMAGIKPEPEPIVVDEPEPEEIVVEEVVVEEEMEFDSEDDELVLEDLSGLLLFRMSAGCKEEARPL
jgi:hypothetical protein